MGVSEDKKVSETPQDAGGNGGLAPEQPKRTRSQARLLQRAANGRWPGLPALKADAIKVAADGLKSKYKRDKLRAAELVKDLEKMEQADQHLSARLQNSGLAIIEARKTIETQPDGTVKETQTMKLYGREAPLEDV